MSNDDEENKEKKKKGPTSAQLESWIVLDKVGCKGFNNGHPRVGVVFAQLKAGKKVPCKRAARNETQGKEKRRSDELNSSYFKA